MFPYGWIKEDMNLCMYVSMYVSRYVCMCIHIGMYAYKMQFLERWISNKEFMSDHRCERINMAAK